MATPDDYMQALQARFSPESLCAEQQAEVMRLHRRLEKKLDRKNQIRLLELVDAEARLRDDVSLESFIAGFRLACGIAHELGIEPPYSFHLEEEERIGKKG
ncbi:DUF6809 family protein [uncultured Oscillibacter sp.]|uniref:DUF6809 family protein n=1 Tax=uncultured Oscillibacter sp. TaxID=876091 RepID=UPI0026356F4C|nr:DUF6809 family protein [uncultured Oscillibacter sp.]